MKGEVLGALHQVVRHTIAFALCFVVFRLVLLLNSARENVAVMVRPNSTWRTSNKISTRMKQQDDEVSSWSSVVFSGWGMAAIMQVEL